MSVAFAAFSLVGLWCLLWAPFFWCCCYAPPPDYRVIFTRDYLGTHRSYTETTINGTLTHIIDNTGGPFDYGPLGIIIVSNQDHYDYLVHPSTFNNYDTYLMDPDDFVWGGENEIVIDYGTTNHSTGSNTRAQGGTWNNTTKVFGVTETYLDAGDAATDGSQGTHYWDFP